MSALTLNRVKVEASSAQATISPEKSVCAQVCPSHRLGGFVQKRFFCHRDFPLYIRVSSEIMEIARKYSENFEQWGIDEAFLDVTSKVKDYVEAEMFGSAD